MFNIKDLDSLNESDNISLGIYQGEMTESVVVTKQTEVEKLNFRSTTEHTSSPLDVEDINKLVKTKKLPVITSNATIDIKTGNIIKGGLFDEDIFGISGSKERYTKFACIDMGVPIVHPNPYSMLVKLMRTFDAILLGKITFSLNKDILEVDGEGKITGVEVLSKYSEAFFNYIDKVKGTDKTKQAKDFLETLRLLNKGELVTNYIPVIPPANRDFKYEPSNNSLTLHEINDFYIEAVNLSSYPDKGQHFYSSKATQLFARIHDYFMREKTTGKYGIIKSKLVKKPVAYAGLSVIASYDKSAGDKWNSFAEKSADGSTSYKLKIGLGEIGVPVTTLLSLLHPFFIYEIREDMKKNPEILATAKKLLEEYTQDDISEAEVASTLIEVLSKDYHFGFKPLLQVEETDVTILDYLKKISYIVVGDPKNPRRFAETTRYPHNNKFSNQYFSAIPVVTHRFKKVGDYEVAVDITTYSKELSLNDGSLNGFGGDFDGDKIVIAFVFSVEANEDVREKAWFRRTNTDMKMSSLHTLQGNEFIWGAYKMTKK